MSIPHPIPYQGSKRALAPEILRYFPDDTDRLIEPFVGAGAVSLAAAQARKARCFALNDVNGPLIDLWRMILAEPGKLAEQYRKLWQEQIGREREYYDWVRDQFNRTRRPDYFLYLLARCVKASVRYNALGEFNQSPDNRRRGAHPKTMAEHIHGASRLLVGRTEIQCGDYRAALQHATPDDLIYMDPPYQGVSGRRDVRYVRPISHSEFVETLRELNTRQLAYVVSYDGRTGAKRYGEPLPATLSLIHIELAAGVSSQATLLGRRAKTYESLYLSPALARRIGFSPSATFIAAREQLALLEDT
jgi:DNA adenine methylase